jgi:hypothetical protein
MNQQEYLAELKRRLTFRGASRRRANDILAEVRSHLADSGEDPVEAFGTPDRYAESVLRGHRWPTGRFLTTMVLSVGGAGVATLSLLRLVDGEAVVSVRTTDLLVWAVLSLVAPLGITPAATRRFPSRGTRTAIFVPMAALAACVASYIGSGLLNERTLVSSSPRVALSFGLGLLAAAVLIALVPHLLRRARRP